MPKIQNLKKFNNNNQKNISRLLQHNAPIVKNEYILITNNFEQKTTLIVDNELYLIGAVDFVILDKNVDKCYIFNIKKVKNIPRTAYNSDKILIIIYNLLLFRFLHRDMKNYQIRMGFEFLENYQPILNNLTSYKIGNPAVGYTTDKLNFIDDLISNPSHFFGEHKNQIFFIPFNLQNLMNSLNQLLEMINECQNIHYIEREHKNMKKCKNCYYNKMFSCEYSLTQ